MAAESSKQWDVVIRPQRSWFDLDLQGVWDYRDLIRLLVRRDIVAVYKQTILGPLWHVIQPLTTTLTFALIFGRFAGLGPTGVPSILFYMSGIVPWMYFANVVTKTSKTFLGGANIMTKVYFPRLVVPISMAVSNLVSFLIQFATFLVFLLFYHFFVEGFTWHVASSLLLLPAMVVLMALLGLSVGIIVSAMTTKYRDLSFLVGFGVQLLMYVSPVIFPLSRLEQFPMGLRIFKMNPMTPVIENFRAIFLGGQLDLPGLGYTAAFTLIALVIGIVMFNRVERSFADII